MTRSKQYDVVSIGETMIRMSPPNFQRLEQSQAMEVHVGGSESNTLAGLSRLGLSTCWISRLTDNALGRMVSRAIAAQGVDTRWIHWTEDDRVGVYFYEPGIDPRPSEVIYDRAHSAYSRMTLSDLPLEPLAETRLFHATGISLALSESVRNCLQEAQRIAVASGAKRSFDFNYRAKLWSIADARVHCNEWMEQSDVVFIALRDATDWLDIPEQSSEESVFARLLARRSRGTTVMTLGPKGAIASDGRRTVRVASTPTEGAGRLGAGDAFSAGFLFGWLQDWELELSLRWANAAAQSKMTTPGDLPCFTKRELESLVDGNHSNRLLR